MDNRFISPNGLAKYQTEKNPQLFNFITKSHRNSFLKFTSTLRNNNANKDAKLYQLNGFQAYEQTFCYDE